METTNPLMDNPNDPMKNVLTIPFRFRVLQTAQELQNIKKVAPKGVEVIILRNIVDPETFQPKYAFMLTSPKLTFGQEFYVVSVDHTIEADIDLKKWNAENKGGWFKKIFAYLNNV